MRAFLQCPLPLYLQFLMREIVCWKSYTLALSWNGTLPPQDIKGTCACTDIMEEDTFNWTCSTSFLLFGQKLSIVADSALNSLASYNDIFTPLFAGVIDCLFSELEDERGCVFVSHALGYITATKYGLTESELLDILICDADVSTKNIATID